MEEKDDDAHQNLCHVCKDGGKLLCCYSCPFAYHIHCLNPPLDTIPDVGCKCPRSSCPPLSGKVKKIISWRWAEVPAAAGSPKKPQTREYLIKWHSVSYWHCEWISELQLCVHHPLMIRSFKRKYNMEEEPKFEETRDADSRYQRIQRHKLKDLI